MTDFDVPFHEGLAEALQGTIGMQSFDRIVTLCRLLMDCEDIPGAVCEFGCNRGKTAALMAALTAKSLWLYDSFEGLPARGPEDLLPDGKTDKGNMTATPEDVRHSFYIFPSTFERVHVVKGWFKDLTPEDLPPAISFAHIDADFYESIKTALNLVYPRLFPGAICVVDDYGAWGYPGVQRAVDEFLIAQQCPAPFRKRGVLGAYAQQCYFYKSV